MSYVRWSSDDFRSDVYCYEHCDGGFTTHVASNRVVGTVPPIRWDLLKTDAAAWVASSKAQHEFLATAEHKPIGLPHDGETFSDPTLEAMRDRLLNLRALGYIVPDGALEGINEEIADSAGNPEP